MRLVLPAILLCVATVAAADPVDDRGPGLIARRNGDARLFPAEGFDHVALATAAQMDIRVGPGFSVRATGPEGAFTRLRVVTEDGGLKVEPRYRNTSWSDADRDLAKQVRFTVTLPRLAGVTLAGSGDMTVDRVEGGEFRAVLGGSGDIALGRLAVNRATVTIGGSGKVTAAGRVSDLQVTLGGSGSFDAPALHATQAKVQSAGSGMVRADVGGPATVRLAGSGAVDLGRGARCDISRIGSGTIHCGS